MELDQAMARIQDLEAILEGALAKIAGLEIELEEAREKLKPPTRLGLREDDAA